MSDEYYNIKKLKVIAYLLYFNEDHPELFFNNEIKFRKLSRKEREYFSEEILYSFSFPKGCLEFTITNEFIRSVEQNYNPKYDTLDEKDWSSQTIENKEKIIISKALKNLRNFVSAINISIEFPCMINYTGICKNNSLTNLKMREDRHFTILERGTKIKKSDINTINDVYNILNDATKEYFRKPKKYWWMISFEYFEKYSYFVWGLDRVIYLTIALESLLSSSNDHGEIGYRLRLRSSLYLYKLVNFDPKQIQNIIKLLYTLRSKIVHGTSTMSKMEFEDINIDDFEISVHYFLGICHSIIRLMLLDVILNQSNKSKNEFIDYIDTIWQFKNPDSLKKLNLENLRDNWIY